jgi:predicted transcriptional regulator
MHEPTAAELAILHILWDEGPQTVRTINERLNGGPPPKPIGYTTTLKHLQLMVEKGLVTRDESQRSHVYTAAIARSTTQRNLLGRFVDRAFGGSRSELVLRVLGDGQTSTEELAEIRRLIDRIEKERSDD